VPAKDETAMATNVPSANQQRVGDREENCDDLFAMCALTIYHYILGHQTERAEVWRG